VEELTPKSKLQSYYEHDYHGLMSVLRKNGKKLAIKLALRKPGEDIKAEFEGSLGKLGPLLERNLEDGPADRCDGVQAVRLTVEEIGIVKGSNLK